MQLWLRDIYDYAMNKPGGEIWPETKQIDKQAYKTVIYSKDFKFEIEVDAGSGEFEFEGRNVETKYVITHRTHCPECWEKFEGCLYLGTEMNEHREMFCNADSDWNDRFPREG